MIGLRTLIRKLAHTLILPYYIFCKLVVCRIKKHRMDMVTVIGPPQGLKTWYKRTSCSRCMLFNHTEKLKLRGAKIKPKSKRVQYALKSKKGVY